MFLTMAATVQPQVLPGPGLRPEPTTTPEHGYVVICWDDPVNLMDYVTHVFQTVFGWTKTKAEHHMLEVHNQGRSVLARTGLEKAEHYVHQLQKYRLQATLEHVEE
jgi:ATP-dependent Clp protease adaptor protein ClpS